MLACTHAEAEADSGPLLAQIWDPALKRLKTCAKQMGKPLYQQKNRGLRRFLGAGVSFRMTNTSGLCLQNWWFVQDEIWQLLLCSKTCLFLAEWPISWRLNPSAYTDHIILHSVYCHLCVSEVAAPVAATSATSSDSANALGSSFFGVRTVRRSECLFCQLRSIEPFLQVRTLGRSSATARCKSVHRLLP